MDTHTKPAEQRRLDKLNCSIETFRKKLKAQQEERRAIMARIRMRRIAALEQKP